MTPTAGSWRFAEAETTEAYMRTLRGYLDTHGRPVAIYSDKHSIFRVNQWDHCRLATIRRVERERLRV